MRPAGIEQTDRSCSVQQIVGTIVPSAVLLSVRRPRGGAMGTAGSWRMDRRVLRGAALLAAALAAAAAIAAGAGYGHSAPLPGGHVIGDNGVIQMHHVLADDGVIHAQ
jgi:hypothetical protein